MPGDAHMTAMDILARDWPQILESSILIQALTDLLPTDIIVETAHLRLDLSFAGQAASAFLAFQLIGTPLNALNVLRKGSIPAGVRMESKGLSSRSSQKVTSAATGAVFK